MAARKSEPHAGRQAPQPHAHGHAAEPGSVEPRAGSDTGPDAGPTGSGGTRGLRIALIVLLGLVLLGRFLPGSRAWGFNHLAYLPVWFLPAWILLTAVLLVPRVQERIAAALAGPIPRFLFERRAAPWILAAGAGALFALLRERSFFMGDGYLIGELSERLVKFRAFDSLDYLLHTRLLASLKAAFPQVSSFTIYRVGSVLGGIVAVLVYRALIARLSWEPWRKAAAWLMLFLIGPATLFFGYVESYTWLLLFVTAFLVSGILVLQERAPLRLASVFFGLALAFHLTALFSAPALLYLALRAPVRPAARRWLEAAVPALVLFGAAVALHLIEGYNGYWIHKEFVDNRNAHSLWVALRGEAGLLTFYHWKDVLNLALITAPVPLVIALTRVRGIRSRLGAGPVPFLLAQIAPIALLALFLDKKLGGARDWDLLAAHSGGLVLLAAFLLPALEPVAARPAETRANPPDRSGKARRPALARPHPVAGMAIGAALLVTAPWVLLLHLEERSIRRFTEVAADFPAFARAYSYEEVGKYYRKANDLERAEAMYERCVASYPLNARFRILLGSIYFSRQKYDQAEAEYRAALARDPNNASLAGMSLEMLGKLSLQRQDYPAALEWFRQLATRAPDKAATWELLGMAAAGANQPEEVLRGFRRAMEIEPSLDHWHDVGVAQLHLGRYTDAAASFRNAMRHGSELTASRLGLATALTEAARAEAQNGRPVPKEWIAEAESQLRIVLAAEPDNPEANRVLRQLRGARQPDGR